MSRARKTPPPPADAESATLDLHRRLTGAPTPGGDPSSAEAVPEPHGASDEPIQALMARYSRSSPRSPKSS